MRWMNLGRLTKVSIVQSSAMYLAKSKDYFLVLKKAFNELVVCFRYNADFAVALSCAFCNSVFRTKTSYAANSENYDAKNSTSNLFRRADVLKADPFLHWSFFSCTCSKLGISFLIKTYSDASSFSFSPMDKMKFGDKTETKEKRESYAFITQRHETNSVLSKILRKSPTKYITSRKGGKLYSRTKDLRSGNKKFKSPFNS